MGGVVAGSWMVGGLLSVDSLAEHVTLRIGWCIDSVCNLQVAFFYPTTLWMDALGGG
jgi:hypothetical protein